jgi:predicted  nucleic acid-binding Zn-ribbon protein
MGEVSLDMIWKRLEEIQAELKTFRGNTEKSLAALNDKVEGMAQTLVSVRRDVRSLQGEVATLSIAIDGHTHRLDEIEKRLGIGTPQN